MNCVNSCVSVNPLIPLRTNERAWAALVRWSALVGTDARLTQPTQAGDVMANLNGSLRLGAESTAGLARGIRQFFGPMDSSSMVSEALAPLWCKPGAR